MYNLKIKNKDTQITILNSSFKTVFNTVIRYRGIGNYEYQITSDEDNNPEWKLNINGDINILCNKSFHDEAMNSKDAKSNKDR